MEEVIGFMLNAINAELKKKIEAVLRESAVICLPTWIASEKRRVVALNTSDWMKNRTFGLNGEFDVAIV